MGREFGSGLPWGASGLGGGGLGVGGVVSCEGTGGLAEATGI